MKIYVLILFLVTLTALGVQGLIGGTLIYPHSLPYMVFLDVVGSTNTTRCSGALISNDYVLTAARCLKNSTSVRVVLGADDVTVKEEMQVSFDTDQSNFIIHENFVDETLENDIALIKLPSSVESNEYIQVISIATEDQVKEELGELVVVSGWGLTYYGYPDSMATVPLAEWLVVLNNTDSECGRFGTLVKDTNICCSTTNSWDGPLQLCDGDWGDPLVNDGKNKTLFGIASFTAYESCVMGKPNIFTNVPKYSEWIKSNANI
ncbi:brachyurin-like [Diabrotica undecimpunctata]|uniref:brachyurin-like n=1 Tax=Diabrotica undecimpunctata TaxID=50387 RepID=UPI003B634EEB